MKSVFYITYKSYSRKFTWFDLYTAHFTAAEQYGIW